jgi:peptidoglycan/LPS O-acetylase OafA/YrhL
MRRIDELTGLRAIAVGLVVIGHAAPFMPNWTRAPLSPLSWFTNGLFGVHIFFVLSGFLITSLLLREVERTGRIDFVDFYRRRSLRIFPAFYAYLAMLGVLTAAGLLDISTEQFVVAGAYLWNYSAALPLSADFGRHADGLWYLGHSWSLAVEEQFYWLWPAIVGLAAGRRISLGLSLVVLAMPLVRIVSYFAFPQTRDQLGTMFHTASDYILVGCLLAMNRDALAARLRPVIANPNAFTVIAIGTLVALPNLTPMLRGYWTASYGSTIEATLIALLLLCMFEQPQHWLCRLLRTRAFMFVGTISYSLYLWQQLFTRETSPVYLGAPLMIIGAMLAATASYYFVELPFLKWKDRKASRLIGAWPEPAPARRVAVDRTTARESQ